MGTRMETVRVWELPQGSGRKWESKTHCTLPQISNQASWCMFKVGAVPCMLYMTRATKGMFSYALPITRCGNYMEENGNLFNSKTWRESKWKWVGLGKGIGIGSATREWEESQTHFDSQNSLGGGHTIEYVECHDPPLLTLSPPLIPIHLFFLFLP